jgi:hypothetical protein
VTSLHTERLLLPFRPRRRWLTRLRAIGAAVVRWHLREPDWSTARPASGSTFRNPRGEGPLMAIYLGTSGVFVINDRERVQLIAALDLAVDLSDKSTRTTRATVDGWRELRKALAL